MPDLSQEPTSFQRLVHESAAPIGLTAPANIQSHLLSYRSTESTYRSLSDLAAEILDDPWRLQQLADQIYDLIQRDIYYQQERIQSRFSNRY